MLNTLPPHRLLALALIALAVPGAPAHAEEAERKEKPITVSGAASLVSDYRWRGYSLSNQTWATQATINLEHRSGLFIGTWASSISEIGGTFTCDPEAPPGGPPICAALAGSTDEVDVYGGWSGTVGPVDVTGGLMAYIYPGAGGFNYFEFYGTVGYTIGTLSITGGLNWAPDQGNLSGSNRYLFGGVSWAIPKSPVTLKATLGSERGSVVLDKTGERTSKFDWLIGADVSGNVIGLSPITFGIGYSSNNLPDRQGVNAYAEGGFFFSLSAGF